VEARPTLAGVVSATSVIPLGKRARWAVVLLAATIVIDVLAIGSDLWQVVLINRFLDGKDTDSGPLASSDHRQAVLSAFQFLVLLASGIVFIRWLHAAYRNIASLGAPELRFKPGWAIGAWFVPFLNLWRPKQIADDIWRGSDPEAPLVQEPGSHSDDDGHLLTTWWALWIVSLFIGNIAGRLFFSAESLPDIRDSDELDMAALAFDVSAAVYAVLVVRHITSRQMQRVERLTAPATSVRSASP
jgi:Domain of unknown function (DUF4328)